MQVLYQKMWLMCLLVCWGRGKRLNLVNWSYAAYSALIIEVCNEHLIIGYLQLDLDQFRARWIPVWNVFSVRTLFHESLDWQCTASMLYLKHYRDVKCRDTMVNQGYQFWIPFLILINNRKFALSVALLCQTSVIEVCYAYLTSYTPFAILPAQRWNNS